MKKLLELIDVTAGYNKEVILRNVNLSIFEQDYIGIIGPNGGGKTTLIRILLGLIKPFSGKIARIDGQNLQIGYLPQQSEIDRRFPITVRDIVLSGLMSTRKGVGRYTGSDRRLANTILEQMGIGQLANRTALELSGGQLQRVFISRALIASPQILILDEPDTFVDNRFESDLYALLSEMNKKMAILIVSHDMGTISYNVKTIACVNTSLHYHQSNIITEEQLEAYNCPLQIITHGDVPHTVLQKHTHDHDHLHP
jgi:zinc transport system ATP-binding protein